MKAMNGYFSFSRAEVGDTDRSVAKLGVHFLQLLVRNLQEVIDQAQFIHHLQGRGMDGIAAEIPEEVGVLLQHNRLDAGATQQIPQHHAGRTAADDAAACAATRWLFRGGTRIHDKHGSADGRLASKTLELRYATVAIDQLHRDRTWPCSGSRPHFMQKH